MSEWDFDEEISPGTSGRRARLVQEWLCLHEAHVSVDGKYGPATAEGVRRFQAQRGLRETGSVNRTTFVELVRPLTNALETRSPNGDPLGRLVISYAKQHLKQHPREVGGQNQGPWVRLYMNGHEGPEWPWCAGFVCFVLRQATTTLSRPMPIQATFSCDLLASDAQQREIFLRGGQTGDIPEVPPGSLFLSRRTAGDWTHTGIVIKAGEESFESIEGNTNDAGDREGYEVCRRVRGYQGKDFIVW